MDQIYAELRKDFAEKLESFRDSLESRGVTFNAPELIIWDDHPEHFTAELRVYFLRLGQIIDTFEFHVSRDGQQLVNKGDLEHWVEEHIASVG